MLKTLGVLIPIALCGLLILLAVGARGCEGEPGTAQAGEIEYSNEAIVTAIGKAENSKKFLYGIKSIKCAGEKACRQICLNSVVNAKKRWEKAGKPEDFVSFMSKRYCPINANAENGSNKFWVKNVKFFLKNG